MLAGVVTFALGAAYLWMIGPFGPCGPDSPLGFALHFACLPL